MDGAGRISVCGEKRAAGCDGSLEKALLTTDDIDWFILHQANQRIVESVAKRLKTDIERFPMNLQEYGNTSSASIPIL